MALATYSLTGVRCVYMALAIHSLTGVRCVYMALAKHSLTCVSYVYMALQSITPHTANQLDIMCSIRFYLEYVILRNLLCNPVFFKKLF